MTPDPALDSRILVAGSSGFVGRNLVRAMARRGIPGVALSRSAAPTNAPGIATTKIADYADHAVVAASASSCSAAVILAGRAHVLREGVDDPRPLFRSANVERPVAIAEACSAAGVTRIVFVSSIAVYGAPEPGCALREVDTPVPATEYGRSKLEGEECLSRRCHELGLELTIVRPPLVYGANAPGNFGRLLHAAKRGIPLPLGAIRNRRHFIGIDNLSDVLLRCAIHREAAGRTFLVSDSEETSTAALARTLYLAAGHQGRLLPVPPELLRLALIGIGRRDTAAQLLDDLRLETIMVRDRLGWSAPVSLAEGLRRCVEETAI